MLRTIRQIRVQPPPHVVAAAFCLLVHEGSYRLVAMQDEPQDAPSVDVEAADPKRARPPLTPPPAGSPATVEIGGRDGPEPTRYGDWEKNGRCIDF